MPLGARIAQKFWAGSIYRCIFVPGQTVSSFICRAAYPGCIAYNLCRRHRQGPPNDRRNAESLPVWQRFNFLQGNRCFLFRTSLMTCRQIMPSLAATSSRSGWEHICMCETFHEHPGGQKQCDIRALLPGYRLIHERISSPVCGNGLFF